MRDNYELYYCILDRNSIEAVLETFSNSCYNQLNFYFEMSIL